MENDAFDASGACDATTVTEGQEHKAASQKDQKVRQLAVGVEKNLVWERWSPQSC